MPEHVKDIFKTLSQLPSREEVDSKFSKLAQLIADSLQAIRKSVDARLAQVKDGKDGRDGRDGAKGAKGDKGDPGRDGRDGRDGIDAAPTDETALVTRIENNLPQLGARVRDGLELLQGEDRLDASAIKNLPNAQEVHNHHHAPPTALWNLMDVDAAGIEAGQALKWTGVRWIPFTPAGGANTAVYNEVVDGSATTFTLDNEPVSGTLRLYANGQRLVPTTEYSLSGATITTVLSWAAGSITADYEHA